MALPSRHCVLMALVAVLAPVAALFAQIPEDAGDEAAVVARPTSAGRVVRHFDFEERGFNAFDVPLYWIRAQNDPEVRVRPGFPISNLARLDYAAAAASGIGSVRLDTSGGSTSLRLESGVVTVFPSVEYAVGAMVRVDGLEHARPRLAARLLDQDGRVLAETETSQIVARPEDGWAGSYVPVLLTLPPAPDSSVSLQIDLELVQPAELHGEADTKLEIWQEDYQGSVWFDDVVVVQLPSASLRTSSASNAFEADQAPEIRATIRDLSGDPLEIRLEVVDLDDRVVASRLERFGMGSREFAWQPDLPGLGWYEARLIVSVGSTPMLRLTQRFVWLPRADGLVSGVAAEPSVTADPLALFQLSDRRRLAIVLPSVGAEEQAVMQPAWTDDLLERSGSRSFFVPVALPRTKMEDSDSRARIIDRWTALAHRISAQLARLNAQATIVLRAVDGEASDSLQSVGDRSLNELQDSELWDGLLVALVDRLAEAVNRWHVGPIGTDVLAATPDAPDALGAISDRLDRLSPNPIVGLPWSGAFDPRQAMLPLTDQRWSLAVQKPMHADRQWTADVARALTEMIDSGTLAEATILVNPLDTHAYGRREAVKGLVQQMLAVWETLPAAPTPIDTQVPASPLRLALRDAWAHKAGEDSPQVSPVLAAWRGVSDRLVGMRKIYDFQTPSGIRATLYEPIVRRSSDVGGLLVLEPAPGTQSSTFEQFLGEDRVRVYDVFGNVSTVEAEEFGAQERETPRIAHRVPLGDLPVFVEGVDTNLLMFIASIRLEPELLEAIDVEHQVALVVGNPWPGVTSVRSRVVSPGGFGGQPVSERAWEIAPRLSDLLIEAGQEQRTPMGIRFRRSEPAGRKYLGLDLFIRGENATRRVHVDVPFRIGLTYLDVIATARRTNDGVLVLVEARNLADRPLTLEATAIAPGTARRRATVPQLVPGATARRELLLRGADLADAGRIILSVEDIDTGARLNYQVDVP